MQKGTLSHPEIVLAIVKKMVSRPRLGYFDHCRDSEDMRIASARARRIVRRVNLGQRMTLREALQ